MECRLTPNHPAGASHGERSSPAGKVGIGFTDDRLTGTGGAAFLAHAAERLGLLPRLAEAVSVKRRARGASDAETQWSLVASLAAGNGSLSDVDALRGDGVWASSCGA